MFEWCIFLMHIHCYSNSTKEILHGTESCKGVSQRTLTMRVVALRYQHHTTQLCVDNGGPQLSQS